MVIGCLLALGMAGLLLVWLNMNTGSGFVSWLFIAGAVVGLAVVWKGATDRSG